MDMFAMFHCGRLDILPVGDLGVRKGFQALYKLKVMHQPALHGFAKDRCHVALQCPERTVVVGILGRHPDAASGNGQV